MAKIKPNKSKKDQEKRQRPPQHQARRPGLGAPMRPQPKADDPAYRGGGKVALITGGDSGIGQAVAIAYAKEGAGG